MVCDRRLGAVVGDEFIYRQLAAQGLTFEYHEHPAAPTVALALAYWKDIPATHCKNLFLRNHKGDRHYLLVAEGHKEVDIHALEHLLHQGKLSFASGWRLEKYLGVKAGSVSPLGLVHDVRHEVMLYLDQDLRAAERLSFHPNDNRASLVLTQQAFRCYLDSLGVAYSYLDLQNPTEYGSAE